MIPEPAVRSDFFDRLQKLVARGAADRFSIAALRRDATNVMKSDFVLANAVLGSLASIEGDFAETKRRFSLALKQGPIDEDMLHNYYIALRTLNVGLDLPQIVEELEKQIHSSPKAIAETAIALDDAGWVRQSARLVSELKDSWSSRVQDVCAVYGFDPSSTSVVVNFLDQQRISDREIAHLVCVAREVFVEAHIQAPIIEKTLVPDGADDGHCLLCEILLDESSESCFALEQKVIERLTSLENPGYESAKIAFLVTPVIEHNAEVPNVSFG